LSVYKLFHTDFTGMFLMLYLKAKFRVFSSSGSLVIAVKRKTVCVCVCVCVYFAGPSCCYSTLYGNIC